jgi:hypothetical protein
MQRFGIGEILAVTNVLNRTYTARLTAHSHGYRVLNQVSPVGGLRRALYESLHQFTILGCCDCCANRNHGPPQTSRRQGPGPDL